jgi:hypothetical protein
VPDLLIPVGINVPLNASVKSQAFSGSYLIIMVCSFVQQRLFSEMLYILMTALLHSVPSFLSIVFPMF